MAQVQDRDYLDLSHGRYVDQESLAQEFLDGSYRGAYQTPRSALEFRQRAEITLIFSDTARLVVHSSTVSSMS